MWMEVGRVPPDVQKFQIRDLQEDHEYNIRIYARNEIGSSEPLEFDEVYKVSTKGEFFFKSIMKCLRTSLKQAMKVYLTIQKQNAQTSAFHRTLHHGLENTTWMQIFLLMPEQNCSGKMSTSSDCFINRRSLTNKTKRIYELDRT